MRIFSSVRRKVRMASNERKADRLVAMNVEARRRAIQRKEYEKIKIKEYKKEIRNRVEGNRRIVIAKRKRLVNKFPKRKGGGSLVHIV